MKQLPISNPKKVISSSLPYHEKLIESCSGHSNDDTLPCRLCNKKIDGKLTRCHVGSHIINEDVQNVCGLQSCSIVLKKSSGHGKTAIAAAESNCTYMSKFSLKSAENSTKTGPYTNRPAPCSVCIMITWSYSLPSQYKCQHPDNPFEEFRILQDEVKLVLTKNSKL